MKKVNEKVLSCLRGGLCIDRPGLGQENSGIACPGFCYATQVVNSVGGNGFDFICIAWPIESKLWPDASNRKGRCFSLSRAMMVTILWLFMLIVVVKSNGVTLLPARHECSYWPSGGWKQYNHSNNQLIHQISVIMKNLSKNQITKINGGIICTPVSQAQSPNACVPNVCLILSATGAPPFQDLVCILWCILIYTAVYMAGFESMFKYLNQGHEKIKQL